MSRQTRRSVRKEVIMDDSEESDILINRCRRSARKATPSKRYSDCYVTVSESNCSSDISETNKMDPLQLDTETQTLKNMENMQFDEEMHAANIFKLQTPKKSIKRATSVTATPTSITKTPTSRNIKTKNAKTPARVRQRIKKNIAKLALDDSTEESDYVPSDDKEDSDDSSSESIITTESNVPKTPKRPIKVPLKLPKNLTGKRFPTTRTTARHEEYFPVSENFFCTHATTTKSTTSNHTLDLLKSSRIPMDQLLQLMSNMKVNPAHEKSINGLLEEYRTYFLKWLCILNEGFNLLLYGLGSKRQIMQDFQHEYLNNQPVIVINGFFPSLTLKQIMDSIVLDILECSTTSEHFHEIIDFIEEEFTKIPTTHLYLIIHNIDGVMLRNNKCQETLARLAKISNIHLIASIDHINTPLLWDQTKLSFFNFSWWDCTTMLPYNDETAYENTLLEKNSGDMALSSLHSVFASLTPNCCKIYILIIEYQLKNKKDNPNYAGMSFKDLYWNCREKFLVSSDLALRAQLTEFIDHKLIKSKRSLDGTEQLFIPIDASILTQFLTEKNANVLNY